MARKFKFKLVIIALVLAEALTHFGIVYIDSLTYFNVTEYFKGQAELMDMGPRVMTRPLVPLLVIPFNLLVRLPVAYGLINTGFWLLTALVLFKITARLTQNCKASLYAALLMNSTYAMLLCGAASLTDTAGLFFTFLGIYLVMKMVEEGETLTRAAIYGLIIGVGSLSREVVFAVGIFALLFAFWRKRTKHALTFLALMLVIPLIWQAFVPMNSIEWFKWNLMEYAKGGWRARIFTTAHFYDILQIIAYSHLPTAIFALIVGFLWNRNNYHTIIFYLTLISTGIVFIAWPAHLLRYAIILYPATMPLAGQGLKVLAEELADKPWLSILSEDKWATVLLVLTIAFNNFWAWVWLGGLSFPWAALPSPGPIGPRYDWARSTNDPSSLIAIIILAIYLIIPLAIELLDKWYTVEDCH